MESRSSDSRINSNLSLLTTSLYRKNFDLNFHCHLEKQFPNSPYRIEYQKRQEKYYKLAIQKMST